MAEGQRIIITRKKAILSREQKTGLGMVVGFGSLALVFGVFFLWKHIAAPFVISYVGPKFLTGDEKQQQEMEALKKQDTDTDGLDDYSELYIYRTSPYLKDSDSDGTEDKTEISQGEDPNCAPNMPCAAAAADAVRLETLRDSFVGNGTDESAAPSAPEAAASPTDIANMLSQMTTEQIRALLIQSGGDAATIDALSDEQLRTALAQALTQLEVDEGIAADQATDSGVTAEAGVPVTDTGSASDQTTL